MRIIVPIKQVPESSKVRMDPESGTIVRDGSSAVVNPLDLYALEAALHLNDSCGATVDVVSMGPRKAETALREAVSMGCDGGYLVTDKAFAGADTWATSYVLAQVITKLGPYDLVITGERATDGDTGQVGPGIASWLEIPCATYVASVELGTRQTSDTGWHRVAVKRLTEDGYQSLKVTLPALLTVVKEIATPRLPTLSGKKRASQIDIPAIGVDDLDVDRLKIGLRGSPTRVVRIQKPKVIREGLRVDARESTAEAVELFGRFLKEHGQARELDP